MPINGPLLFRHSHRLLSLSIFFNLCNRVTEWKLIKKKKKIWIACKRISAWNFKPGELRFATKFAISALCGLHLCNRSQNQSLKLAIILLIHFYNFLNTPPLNVIKMIVRFVSKVLKKRKNRNIDRLYGLDRKGRNLLEILQRIL